jgi:hypothetical protein
MQIETIKNNNQVTFLINITKPRDENTTTIISQKLTETFTIYSGGLYDLLRFRLGLVHNCWFSTKDNLFEVTFTTLNIYTQDVEREFKTFFEAEF